ncbi:hypothetical protein [Emticicia sp. 21SJ11W-3]|uniref:hypothetical protein n=1 Tax=Emticicia sp. 21SJ11W-3 TaxID=2916755 RepID=UPI00209F9C6E|nr:hypothetical protein [Emticicia sp. 21SJ11W-3]UTA67719.1 hypothetical protein MB380_19285 [Emticicia sp. 21SJ11W-3]
MKKNIILAGIMALPFFTHAQSLSSNTMLVNNSVTTELAIPKNGIFINAEEFQNGMPELGFDKKSKQNHIHEFDNKVFLTENTEKASFPKSAIWGFRKNNQDYRTFQNTDYAVAYAPKGLPILFYTLGEVTGEGNIKDDINTNYYFSRNSQSAIYPLTLANVKEVFSDQLSFVKALDGSGLSDDKPIHEISKVLAAYVRNNVN